MSSLQSTVTVPDGAESSTWRNRIVRYGNAEVAELLSHPLNWRVHDVVQQQALKMHLDLTGWVKPVILQDGTNVIVDGHLRISLALREGQTTVPALWTDLDDEEVQMALASLDAIGRLAGTDREKLTDLLAGLGRAARAGKNETMSSLMGAIAQTYRIESPDVPVDLQVDHGAAIRIEDRTAQDTRTRDWSNDRYAETAVRQMVLIMDQDQYLSILGQFRDIQQQYQLDTNMNVVLFLLDVFHAHPPELPSSFDEDEDDADD